jgi:hypothetical protein
LYRYILFIADFARHKFPEEIDSYADYYYWDIEIADLKQVQYCTISFYHFKIKIILYCVGQYNNNSKLKMYHCGA